MLCVFWGFLPNGLLDPRFSRVFSLEHRHYGMRGAAPYFKPTGWVRFGVQVDDFDLYVYHGWQIAYHGTRCKALASILLQGLQRPGEKGVEMLHGHGARGKRAIYVSPSVNYAAFPVHSQLYKLDENRWGPRIWPRNLRFDQNFDNESVEWLLHDPADVVTGILMRKFGSAADATIFGDLASFVTCGDGGAEFAWTRLMREEAIRKRWYCFGAPA